MSNQQPSRRDNSLPPRPGSGPKPEVDERLIRSKALRPRSAEPGQPATGPEPAEDPAAHQLEQLQEYHRRIRETQGED
jgi:hypothetical protein